jgi:predicted metal-dependent phosphoesterase TrpH
MLVDLHVHTNLSSDSRVAAEQYLEAIAKNATPLGALCFTEHRLFPVDDEIDRTYAELSQHYGVHIFKGVEADTNLGHLLIFGITREFRRRFNLDSRLLRAEHVIEVVHGEGGIAIPAHPFRDSGYGMRLDDLLAKLGPALSAIEAVNGQNSADQNAEAIAMAEKLGLTPLGGSDAHFSTANWFLTCATELDREVGTVEELCVELRAGRARPYYLPRDDGATDQ